MTQEPFDRRWVEQFRIIVPVDRCAPVLIPGANYDVALRQFIRAVRTGAAVARGTGKLECDMEQRSGRGPRLVPRRGAQGVEGAIAVHGCL